MASSRDRQRKLARAKLERQLARRAAAERRRRQIQAGVGAASRCVLIVAGAAWAAGRASTREPEPTAAEDVCLWTPQDADGQHQPQGRRHAADHRTCPPPGTATMTITTNQGGPITAELDLASAPCAAASIAYLAGKKFYDNTKCHEITAEGALHCGDPSGTGLGGPTYTFDNENVPHRRPSAERRRPAPAPGGQPPTLPEGHRRADRQPAGHQRQPVPASSSRTSARPTPAYPIVGTVTAGLDMVEKIGALPTVDNGGGRQGQAEDRLTIQSSPSASRRPSATDPGRRAAPAPAPAADATSHREPRPADKPGGDTVTSTRDRQRAAARARLEREMAERRPRPPASAGSAGVSAPASPVVVIAGAVWIVDAAIGGDDDDSERRPPATAALRDRCTCTADARREPAPPRASRTSAPPPTSTCRHSGTQTHDHRHQPRRRSRPRWT